MKKKIFGALLAIVVLFSCALGVYASDYYHAQSDALSYMENTKNVTISYEDGYVLFEPTNSTNKGLIFYPGGKVEYIAYSPILEQLAEQGITVILEKMPLNLAVFGKNKANGMKTKYDEITDWYIGGHSLGGAMAASYASENTDWIDGEILLAAYSTVDISDTDLNVILVRGSNDKVLKMDSYEKYYSNLPEDKHELIIEGGNHGQFGDYGFQEGDGEATISASEQWSQTVDFIIDNWE